MSIHPSSQSWGNFSLRELVDDVCGSLASHFSSHTIQTVIDIPSDHRVTANRELLCRAVRNLVLHAIDAMPEGGTMTATSAVGPHAVELEIADTGRSLMEEELQQAFSSNTSGQGVVLGWGLAVVGRIAELHGGGVTAANCPEGGVALTLRIPKAAAQVAAA